MIRALSVAMSVALGLSLAACGGKSAPPAPPTPTETEGHADTGGEMPADDTSRVCCESFGYGAQMVKCCESYAWTTAEECTVPEGLVGGGKQVVSGDHCGK